jgi:hypothetical protein
MVYDIIFSINIHESYECTINMIDNIKLCNQYLNFLILIHPNIKMYEELKKYSDERVLLNDKPYDKIWLSHTILKGHIDNFIFLKEKNISFKHFMFLASNCMFIKKNYVPYSFPCLDAPLQKNIMTNLTELKDWHWPTMKKNQKILKVLRDNNVGFFENGKNQYKQHEGAVLSYDVMDKISDFIIKNNIFSIVESDTCFEETLLPSLENYFTGVVSDRACRVFWEKQHFSPLMIDILNTCVNGNQYIVKRVNRYMDDPNRILINYITKYDIYSTSIIQNLYTDILRKLDNNIYHFGTDRTCIKYGDGTNIHFHKIQNRRNVFYTWFGRYLPIGTYTFDFNVVFNRDINAATNTGIKVHNPDHIYNIFDGMKANETRHVNVDIVITNQCLVIFYFDEYDNDLYMKINDMTIKCNNSFITF